MWKDPLVPIRFRCSECGKIKEESRFACASAIENEKAFDNFKNGKIYKTGFMCFECQKKKGIKIFPILEKTNPNDYFLLK